MRIYQVLTRLWGKGRFSSFDNAFFGHLRSLAIDAVWFTGIPRHASGEPYVKGCPGSPYSVSDYYDTNPYLADDPARRMQEFCNLVRRCHRAGMKVLIDFVPNHVSPDAVNGIPVFDHWDYDWSDTRKIDWSNPATLPAMTDILRFWASKGVDGFRCDMVELVPLDSLRALIAASREDYHSLIFISEVYNMDSYGSYIAAGFDLLYDKSGFYDSVRSVITASDTARRLTWNWQRIGPGQSHMLNFLENHDEQRFASVHYASIPEKAFAAMAVACLFNGASAMLYFGQEVGESAIESSDGRTSIFSWCHPASIARLFKHLHSKGDGVLNQREAQLLARYRALMQLSACEPFVSGANYDLCWCQDGASTAPGFDADRHFAFLRYGPDAATLVVCNFGSEESAVRVRVPGGLAGVPSGDYLVEVPAWDYKILKLR